MRLVSKEPNSAPVARSELGCIDLAAQCAKSLSEYTRDVNLRTSDAFRDLGCDHILEESKHQGGSLTLRQSSDQGTYRFNVDHGTQVGIDVAEALTERSVFVVWPGRHVGRTCGVVAARDHAFDNKFAVDAKMIRDSEGVNVGDGVRWHDDVEMPYVAVQRAIENALLRHLASQDDPCRFQPPNR